MLLLMKKEKTNTSCTWILNCLLDCYPKDGVKLFVPSLNKYTSSKVTTFQEAGDSDGTYDIFQLK